jgi:hypothetical protein
VVANGCPSSISMNRAIRRRRPQEIEEFRSVIKSLKPGGTLQFSAPQLVFGDKGQTMHSTEARIIKSVAATFYELMRQIYLEQVWRQNQQSATNRAGDRKEDLVTSDPWGIAEARSLRISSTLTKSSSANGGVEGTGRPRGARR